MAASAQCQAKCIENEPCNAYATSNSCQTRATAVTGAMETTPHAFRAFPVPWGIEADDLKVQIDMKTADQDAYKMAKRKKQANDPVNLGK